MSLSPMSIEREENRVGGRENGVLYPWDLEMVGRPLPKIQGGFGQSPVCSCALLGPGCWQRCGPCCFSGYTPRSPVGWGAGPSLRPPG